MTPELKCETKYFNKTHKEKYYVAWYYDGKDGNPVYHCENGPACIYYHTTGEIFERWYIVHGKSHRLDGPAIIRYDVNGNIIREEYFVFDKPMTEDEYKIFVFAFKSELQ